VKRRGKNRWYPLQLFYLHFIFFIFFKKRLKDDLRQQLIDCGWREQVKLRCKAIIKERGMDITVEELIGAVSQSANDSVPDEIRNDVLLKLKHFLSALERGGDAP
jgi:enhancer of yellow 2 transcription factor